MRRAEKLAWLSYEIIWCQINRLKELYAPMTLTSDLVIPTRNIQKFQIKSIQIKGKVFGSGNSGLGEHAPIVVWMHTKTQMDGNRTSYWIEQ